MAARSLAFARSHQREGAPVTTDRVVVVGGGLAGLSAALELADAGVPVTLLESRSRLGGATWSFRRNGLWFDNGQHVFLRCCTAYRTFLDRIGAAGSVRLQERMELPVLAPGRDVAVLRRNRLPAPLHLAGSLLRYHHLAPGDRLRLGRALVPLRRADLDDPSLDERTFAEFLGAHGQRRAAVERLWDLICVPTVNLPAADASLALAATVFQIGLLSDAAAGDIGWSEVPLGRLHADPAARALDRAGADIRTSTPVESVERGAGGVVVATATERVRAGAVIVAVPHDTAAALLPGAAGAREWPALGTSPIVNVHLVYDRPVVPHPMAAVIDSPLQFVFDRTETSGLGAGGGQVIAVSLSAATDWVGTPSDALVATVHGELARLFPDVAAARRLDAVVIRERAATFRGGPGTRALRPATRSDVPGVYLAGAWTATGWPATMEGAVRSGVAAARAVLADLATAASTAAEEVVA
jgi:squalene-associated FAD-dependent desaturase